MASTIKDIAKRLNISTSTVSYALNGGPRTVPPDVRKRVLDIARELDYRPNRVARSLVTRRTKAIGVVPPSTEADVFLSPFVRLAWNALVNEAEMLGQDLLLFTGHNRNLPGETGNELLDGRIDGVVFIAPRADVEAIPYLAERGFPFALIASEDASKGPSFNCDNAGGVYQAIDHLYELGHRRIAHITGVLDSSDARRRLHAFHSKMSSLGLVVSDEDVQIGNFTIKSGYEAGKRLLGAANPPSAVFTANDEMAYGFCQALREAGLSVPEDVSIVGFDDCDMSYAFNPPITTVRQPVTEVATAALRTVVALAKGANYLSGAQFSTQLIIRGSTAAIAGLRES